jgi:oligopeptide transport system substrate-binding protein
MRKFLRPMVLLGIVSALAACGGAAQPQTVEKVVEKVVTQVVEVEKQVTTIVEKEVEKVVEVTPQAGEAEKVVRINLGTYPDVIDPQKSSYVNEIAHLRLVYEGLTKLDKDLNTVPAAAEKWEYNEDATELVFTLREGATYSDGEPVTAANFEFGIKRNCDPNVAGEYQSITFEIVGCEEYATADLEATSEEDMQKLRDAVGAKASEDGKTLTISLKKPAPYFHTVMSLWVTYPVREDKIAEGPSGGELWWTVPSLHVGNGPFIWKTLEPQVKSVFVPNPNYYEGAPKTSIEYAYITEGAVAFEAYKNNEFDIVIFGAEDLATIDADPVLSKEKLLYPGACTSVIAFNNKKAPFDNMAVRQAFAQAFDREAFGRDVEQGLWLPTQTWIPPGFPGYEASESWPFDPEAAAKGLADAGFAEGKGLPEIKLTYASSARNKVRNEWYANQIKENLGIDVVLDPVEPTTYTALTKDNATFPHLGRVGWCADYPDPQNWLSVYWHSQATFANRYGYANPEFDKLTEEADTSIDAEKRMELYMEAQRILIQDSPGVFLVNDTNHYLVKPWVTGLTFTPQDTEWAGAMSSRMTIDVDMAAKMAAQNK